MRERGAPSPMLGGVPTAAALACVSNDRGAPPPWSRTYQHLPRLQHYGHGIGRSIKVVWLFLADLLLSAEAEIERRSPRGRVSCMCKCCMCIYFCLLLVLVPLLGSIGNLALLARKAPTAYREALVLFVS